GTLFVMITTGLITFISAQGQAKTAMGSVLIGAICNIILDPIFIFALNHGIKGADIATVITHAISAAWVIRLLT
ncbi:polysaccharide biosynthesis C-terminal domain-containing protein, partial [Coprococcus eutactus]